jgi:hypothetical protein
MHDLESELALGLASLLAIAPNETWDRLMEIGRLEGEIENTRKRARPLLATIKELSEIQERGLMGVSEPGDRFRTYRLLLRFSKADLLRLIVDIGLPDSEAVWPWKMELKARRLPVSRVLDSAEIKRLNRRAALVADEDATVRRVIAYREEVRVSLADAINAVAGGKDWGGGLLNIKPRLQSVPTVRAKYMRGIKRAKEVGWVSLPTRGGGMFGNKKRLVSLETFIKKGRRPNQK